MARSSEWLPDLVGPPRIKDGETDLPRRKYLILEGDGYTATDDAAADATRLALTGGSAGVQSAGLLTIPLLRAIASADRTDKQRRTVNEDTADIANPQPASFVFIADKGAGVADDSINVIRPNDVLVGSAGRWYRDPLVATTARHGVMPPTDYAASVQNAANLLQADATLSDASQTVQLSGGRRRTIATLTDTRVITLGTTSAVAGDTMTFVRTSVDPFHVIFRVGSTDIGRLTGPGQFSARYTGSTWVVNYAAPNSHWSVFNVRDFGARGDESQSASDTATAIQAAIDAANDATAGQQDGAVVYFPRGRHRIDGTPLVMRRTELNRPLIYRGEGWGLTQITNTTGPVFEVEQLVVPSDPDDERRNSYWHIIEHLELVTVDDYCINWDLGGTLSDSVRPQLFMRSCIFARTQSTGAAVRINHGFRCVADQCMSYGSGQKNGATMFEITNGSFGASFCYQLGGGSRFIYAEDAGEITLHACRSEGGWNTPEFEFINCEHVQLSFCSSEGKFSDTAIYYFEDCNGVTLDQCSVATNDGTAVRLGGLNPQVARPDITFDNAADTITRASGSWVDEGFEIGHAITTTSASNLGPFTITGVSALVLTCAGATFTNETVNVAVYYDEWADGISFVNCRSVRGTIYVPGTFYGGDPDAVAVRVDAACRDIHIVQYGTGVQVDAYIDPAATNCSVETSGASAMVFAGTKQFGAMTGTSLTATTVEAGTVQGSSAAALNVKAQTGQAIVAKVGSQDILTLTHNTGGARVEFASALGMRHFSSGLITIEATTSCGINGATSANVSSSSFIGLNVTAGGTVQLCGASTTPGGGVIAIAPCTAAPATNPGSDNIWLYADAGSWYARTKNGYVTTIASATPAARVGQLTDSTGGTPATTVPDVGAAFNQADLNNIVASLIAKINALETIIHDRGLSQ